MVCLYLSAVLLLSSLIWTGRACGPVSFSSGVSCVSIADTPCGKFYPSSYFPNGVTESMAIAKTHLQSYQTFFASSHTNCSSSNVVAIYLCLALMPMCVPAGTAPPCRHLCELARDTCSQELDGLLTNRDSDISCLFYDCTRFPLRSACFGVNDSTVMQALATTAPTAPTPSTDSPDNSTAPSVCPLPNNTFFSESSKSFAIGWVSFWSVLCFISTTLTILTFLLDTSRFEYPWRPVVYLALAFNIHSVAYFFTLALGRRLVTCPDGRFVGSTSTWAWAHTPCILVFIFLYYTMMAAFIWWVILTVCWFLVSALQWSHEAVGKLAPLYQAIAWILPLLMTISLLAARVVGADELTGACFVVSDSSRASFLALLLGVVVPLALFLVIGVIFLLLGFIGMLRIRAFMHRGGKQQERQSLEKLMVRIGIFVTVYIIPASVLVGCFAYELASRSGWQALDKSCSSCSRPNSAVFMVRIFMFLLIGTLTGVWIWSHKTLKSWQQLPAKCGTCCRELRHEEDREVTPVPMSAENMMGKEAMMMPSYSYPDSGLDST